MPIRGSDAFVTREAGVAVSTAAAASSAVPGLFPLNSSLTVAAWTAVQASSGAPDLDVLAGAQRVLVLALSDGSELTEGMMTSQPSGGRREIEDLMATGTKVELRTPEAVDPLELMSPASVLQSIGHGRPPGLLRPGRLDLVLESDPTNRSRRTGPGPQVHQVQVGRDGSWPRSVSEPMPGVRAAEDGAGLVGAAGDGDDPALASALDPNGSAATVSGFLSHKNLGSAPSASSSEMPYTPRRSRSRPGRGTAPIPAHRCPRAAHRSGSPSRDRTNAFAAP